MMKREGRIWIRIFPDKPVTKKPAETRMGKGKGAPEYWVAVVKPGRIMFEIGGTTKTMALEALRLASHKLPDQDQDQCQTGLRRSLSMKMDEDQTALRGGAEETADGRGG